MTAAERGVEVGVEFGRQPTIILDSDAISMQENADRNPPRQHVDLSPGSPAYQILKAKGVIPIPAGPSRPVIGSEMVASHYVRGRKPTNT